jgi:hypothetical protein
MLFTLISSVLWSLSIQFCFAQQTKQVSSNTAEIYAEFVTLNYTWDSTHVYEEYVNSGKFIVSNCILAGIKIDAEQNIFVTVPRWRPGVPATLNKLIPTADSTLTTDFVLEPYPSWDIQEEGVPGDLQFVQSMIIDAKSRMWVIEVGRTNIFEAVPTDGTPGIWIIDLLTDTVISKYYFPESVASSSNSFVNDIVLDENLEIAYLSDAWGDGGLIVYDYKGNTSLRYSGPSTERDPSYVMIINGVNYGNNIFTTPVDGIGLSPDYKYVYYCNVQGRYLYRIPAAVLRDPASTQEEIDNAVVNLGTKPPSDGIQFWGDVLYYGSLPESTYYAVQLGEDDILNVTDKAVPVWPDQVNMRWVRHYFCLFKPERCYLIFDVQIDTFSLDLIDSEVMWFVSNSLDLYIVNEMDFSGESGPNMRISRSNHIKLILFCFVNFIFLL